MSFRRARWFESLAVGVLLLAGATAASADTLTWDPGLSGGSGGNGTWDLNTTANWFSSTTGTDVKWTDNSALGVDTAVFLGTAGTVTLNSSLSASNLQFFTSGYTLSGTGALTLGAGGIDASALSSGATTIGFPLTLVGQQMWQVGPGGTLAVNGALTRTPGAAVDFSATGVTTTNPSLTNDASGILGAWATVGGANSGAGDWAANDGSGNIITYTNYTVISSTANSTQTGAGAANQNWICGDPTGANNYVTTLSASATINSLVMRGDFGLNSGVTLTLGDGGLILRGVSRWMLGGASCYLTTGNRTGELFVHAPNPGSGLNWTIWPVIQDNGSTPLILVKDGVDEVKLGNMSTYTGGTIVNAGILASTAGVEYGNGNAPLGIITPFGFGPITVQSGAQLQLGSNPGNAFGEYDYTNNISVNGGFIYERDAFHHLKGALAVGPLGATLGATYDNKGDALNNGFAKGLFVDGYLTGSGPLTVQDSGLEIVNPWDSSTVYFTSQGTAAQNTYSGTVTVVNWPSQGGSYLYLIGTNALANATINLMGDNSASSGRFGAPSLLFGSGTNLDGVGYATIGGLEGYGNFVLANTLVSQSGSSLGAPFGLSVGNNNSSTTYYGAMSGAGSLTKVGTGTLTLAGANTYTGDTMINAGTLALSGNPIMSTNIYVAHGAMFDVSSASFTLAGYQSLFGGGTINGSFNTSAGSKIYAGLDGTYGTNAFNNDLTFAPGATVYLDLGDSATGSNDLITVAGALTANNNLIHLKAPSTSDNLDTADYTLIKATGGISGTFGGVVWDVAPANSAHYSLVVSGNAVTLHYSTVAGPTGIGSATPSPARRNQNVLLTVTAANGTAGTVNGVTVDATPIGGSSSVALVNAGNNVWTNTIAVGAATPVGNVILVATITDTASMSGSVNIPLTIIAGNDVWNGLAADDNFSSNLNWTNGTAPGLIGDSLEFAGTTRLTPNMDNNYTVTSLTFDSGAGSFNIGSSSGSTLTLTGSGTIVNNSVNNQTLNVAVADAGGGLTKAGNGPLTLAGNNTFTGPALVSAGTLNLSGAVTPGYMTVGNAAGSAVLNLSGSASLTASNLFVGNATSTPTNPVPVVAAVYQTGGNVTLSGGTGDLLNVGNASGSFGYYNASGGTMTLNGISIGGESNPNVWPPQGSGDGIMEVNGTTINNNGWIVLARGGSAETGVLNVFSGLLTYEGGGLAGNWQLSGSGQTSIINILGGSVTSTSQGVHFRSVDTGVLNLNGGLLEGSVVDGPGTLNFNGGTLQANASSAAFINVTGGAYLYSGGGTIDNNGNAITVSTPLLAASGYGVSAIALSNGGTGYIAPPIVAISGGSGSGATAIAQINPATGVVTNLIVTCPGSGYSSSDVLTVSFNGGGGTGAAASAPVLAQNASGGLTSIGSGSLTLSGASTYSGATVVGSGTLALGVANAINNSTNIIVGTGATFDLTPLTSYALASGQTLSGSGTITYDSSGSFTAGAGSTVSAGTASSYGTNTFQGGLTLSSGAACSLALGPVANGDNDQIVVNGVLTANGNAIHLAAPSSSVSLDTNADYVLITSLNPISGSFASAPIWDVIPPNAGHYTIVTSGNTVTLHYNAAAAAPTVAASANPTTLVRNQPTVISANVIPGNAPISTVTVDLTSLGSSVVTLVQSNASNIYTNTVTVPAAASPGNVSVTVTATDTSSLSGSAAIPLTINATTEVWNGGGSGNWSDNADWVSGYAPGFAGDALWFAGSTGLTPNMDNNYSATGLTFSNNASSFSIVTANGSTLTLTANGIVNNSTSGQTIGVPVTLAAGAVINTASGDIALTNGLSASSLNKTGPSTLTLSGTNNYSGNASVSAGTVSYASGAVVNAGGTLMVGTAGGSGTMNVNSGSAVSFGSGTSYVGYQTGVGTLNINGGSFTNLGELRVGGSDASGTGYNAHGTLVMNGGTVMLSTSSSGPNVGLTIARGNNYQNGCSGDVYINGGTFTCAGDVTLGFAGAGHAHLAINNGALFNFATTVLKWFQIPQYDTTTGELDITNGILNVNAGSPIRFSSGNNTTGINVINLEGGAINFYSDFATTLGGGGRVDMCAGSGGFVGTNIFNLDGGTITVPQIISSLANGTRWFNFNGGTLKATGDNATFLNLGTGNAAANVRNGGAIIDDGGFSVTISQALVHSTFAGDNTVDGGLTKLGAGTLTLSGANTYNGNTTVKAGTLELAQATLATSSTVSITNGAMLKLDFATTNQVGALVLNGVTQPPGIYNSNTAPAYIAGAGSLIVLGGGGGTFTSTPGITGFTLNGLNVVINATNGEAGAAYYLLQSTNVALPLSQWRTVATNIVNASGSFTFTGTNVVTPGDAQQFYILSNTNSNH